MDGWTRNYRRVLHCESTDVIAVKLRVSLLHNLVQLDSCQRLPTWTLWTWTKVCVWRVRTDCQMFLWNLCAICKVQVRSWSVTSANVRWVGLCWAQAHSSLCAWEQNMFVLIHKDNLTTEGFVKMTILSDHRLHVLVLCNARVYIWFFFLALSFLADEISYRMLSIE